MSAPPNYNSSSSSSFSQYERGHERYLNNDNIGGDHQRDQHRDQRQHHHQHQHQHQQQQQQQLSNQHYNQASGSDRRDLSPLASLASVSSLLDTRDDAPAQRSGGRAYVLDEETAKLLTPLLRAMRDQVNSRPSGSPDSNNSGPRPVSSSAGRRETGSEMGDQDDRDRGSTSSGDRRRQTQACDRCRVKKRKCDGATPYCGNCVKAEGDPSMTCTYQITTKKRGPKKGYRDHLMERMATIEAMLKSGSATPAALANLLPQDREAIETSLANSSGGQSMSGVAGSSSSSPQVGLQQQQQLGQQEKLSPYTANDRAYATVQALLSSAHGSSTTSPRIGGFLPSVGVDDPSGGNTQRQSSNVSTTASLTSSPGQGLPVNGNQLQEAILAERRLSSAMQDVEMLLAAQGARGTDGSGVMSGFVGHGNISKPLNILPEELEESLLSFQSVMDDTITPMLNLDPYSSLYPNYNPLMDLIPSLSSFSNPMQNLGFNANEIQQRLGFPTFPSSTEALYDAQYGNTTVSTSEDSATPSIASRFPSPDDSPGILPLKENAGTTLIGPTAVPKAPVIIMEQAAAVDSAIPATSLSAGLKRKIPPSATESGDPSNLSHKRSSSSQIAKPPTSAMNDDGQFSGVEIPEQLSELSRHLIDLFFCYLHATVHPVFHEPTFFADLVPENRHPSFLLNAICAVSAMFSTHPGIEKMGGPARAAAEFVRLANEGLRKYEEPRKEVDNLAVVQALLLISMIEFGWDQPISAHRTIQAAIRMAIRLKMDREDPNIAMNPLSIWQGRNHNYTSSQMEVRRRVWSHCMLMDACAGAVSGLPLAIDETAYPFLLSERRELPTRMAPTSQQTKNDSGANEDGKGKATGEGAGAANEPTEEERVEREMEGERQWKRVLENPTTDTVYHRSQPAVKPPEPVVYSSADHVAVNQISYLLRRVLRLNYALRVEGSLARMPHVQQQADGSASGEANSELARANLVRGVTPVLREAKVLHDALVDWYAMLPDRYKPFDSLMDFSSVATPSKVIWPKCGSTVGGNFLPEFAADSHVVVMCFSTFLTALSTLHLPRADDTKTLYKAAGGEFGLLASAYRCSSTEIVVLARRAHTFVMKILMPGLGAGGYGGVGRSVRSRENGHSDVEGDGDKNQNAEAVNNGNMSSTKDSNSMAVDGESSKNSRQGPPPSKEPGTATYTTAGDYNVAEIVGRWKFDEMERRARQAITTRPPSDKDLSGFSAADPPAPPCVSLSPLSSFHIFTLSAAALAVCGFSHSQTAKAKAVEAERGVVQVYLPANDLLARIWPVAGVYGSRLRRVVAAVQARWGVEDATGAGAGSGREDSSVVADGARVSDGRPRSSGYYVTGSSRFHEATIVRREGAEK
ncbi:hypothetical protein HDU76_003823 [Blyttiomyces sp. JEL0837]|nr:hypothetical protein HDU76_003823 [Blyttiomyces sp. JEL0837]